MEPSLATALLFGSMIILLLLGLPIAFALGGIAVIFTLWMWGTPGLLMIISSTYGQGTSFVLVALPLFILMANFLGVSGIADDLYNTMYHWVGHIPGGLASGTVVACALFAAMAGISGAATVSMGLIAIPSMLQRGYDKRMTLGTVAAGGALGILIPPSFIAIIYASVTAISVGKLFMGGLIPGIMLAVMFIIYISIRCRLNPTLGPPVEERFTWREKFNALRYVAFPLIIIFMVLGSIYFGITTPSEAAGVGAFGAMIACVLHRRLTWANLKTVVQRSLSLSAMCLWIVIGATCFSRIYSAIGASEFITSLVMNLNIPPLGVIWIMMFILFILGMFIETTGICLITVPVFIPIVHALGFDPLWFGILFIVNTEMGLISPPFGMTLFWLKGVVPKGISIGDIYRSVFPFILIQATGLALVVYFPVIATWLPSMMIPAQ